MYNRKVINFLVVTALVLFFSCKGKNEKIVSSYYDDGSIKSKTTTIDGEKEGLKIDYFKNGKIRARSNWKKNKQDGKTLIYYENGNIRQENNYVNGVRCCISLDFFENGFLKQKTELDSTGQIVDYYHFKEDGTRDFDPKKKVAVFLREKDTVELGDRYTAKIKLANRQYGYVRVYLSELIDDEKDFLLKDPLPKIDSLTSQLSILADSVGIHSVSGYILESDKNMDSVNLIPFSRSFYVRNINN